MVLSDPPWFINFLKFRVSKKENISRVLTVGELGGK